MAPLKVLIVGGGVAGTALAHFLARLSRPIDVTVIERTPSLRVAGQQIDLRGAGLVVMERAGLSAEMRACAVPEEGLRLVDRHGKEKAFFGVNKSGRGRQSFTSEMELMRGDLVRILYEATKDKVKYVFGVTADKVQATEDDQGVMVSFSDGSEDTFGLVVGADGQNSRMRRTVFAPGANGDDAKSAAKDADFHFLNMYIAYFSTEPLTDLPATAADWTVCHYSKGRVLMTRTGDARCTQFYFVVRHDHPLGHKLDEAITAGNATDTAAQKAVWADIFRDAGWLSERAMGLMAEADDFYGLAVGQVRMDRPWSKGRVVLLGDAAYCPSVLTGFGTTTALAGAYVLAGELGKAMMEGKDGPVDVPAALAAYEKTLRPFLATVQKLPPGTPKLFHPSTTFGIWMLHTLACLFTKLGLYKLTRLLGPDDSNGWTVPKYPELDESVHC